MTGEVHQLGFAGPIPPPTNYEAEQALLGAILANNRALEKVADFLHPEHFADEAHGRIFEACGKLIERGWIANAVTLKNLFEQDDALTDVGGARYLADLQENYVTIINAAHYGRTIHDLHLRRELIAIGEDLVVEARNPDLEVSPSAQIEAVEQRLYELADAGSGEAGTRSLGAAMYAWIETVQAARSHGGVVGVPTGLKALDRRLGGLHPTDLIVLGGRPSMGKTALAVTVGLHAARSGTGVLFVSQEMSDEQLAGRALAMETGISADMQRRGAVVEGDIEALMDARRVAADLPFEIVRPQRMGVAAIRAFARRARRKGWLGLIIVDYLQLLVGGRVENRVQEVSAISRDLKALAMNLGVPVLALSQLSRQSEQRDDKRPILSDLRESGTIEQDADVVLFVYREYEYAKRDREPRGEADRDAWQEKLRRLADRAEVIIAKNRHGPVAEIACRWDANRTLFSDGMD